MEWPSQIFNDPTKEHGAQQGKRKQKQFRRQLKLKKIIQRVPRQGLIKSAGNVMARRTEADLPKLQTSYADGDGKAHQ